MKRRSFLKLSALLAITPSIGAYEVEPKLATVTEEEIKELSEVVNDKLSKEAMKMFDKEVMNAYSMAADLGTVLAKRQDQLTLEVISPKQFML